MLPATLIGNAKNFVVGVDQVHYQHSPPPKGLEGQADRESSSEVDEMAVATEPLALKVPGPHSPLVAWGTFPHWVLG